MYLDPTRGKYMTELCAACQDGQDVECMRDAPGYGGQCPVADTGPQLVGLNVEAATIFQQAQGSSVQVESGRDRKVYMYVRPGEVEALMRVHGIAEVDRAAVMERVLVLQDISNRLRPSRPPRRLGAGGSIRGRRGRV